MVIFSLRGVPLPLVLWNVCDYMLYCMFLNADLTGTSALLFSFYPVFTGILGISYMERCLMAYF